MLKIYLKSLYLIISDNLKEINEFLYAYHIPKANQT